MAKNEQILEALAKKTAPISITDLAKELGVKANDIATPLKRLTEKDPPQVARNDQEEYTITEEGIKVANPPTEKSEKVTEAEVFKDYGIRIGVPRNIVELTQEHIWDGGNWKDLKSVMQGFIEMHIQSDMRDRWWNLWRGYLHQGIPAELVGELGSKEDRGTLAALGATGERVTDSKDSTKGSPRLRDYIIDASNNPLYVGEGLGDMEYADAMALVKLREAGKARIPVGAVDGGGGAKGDRVTDAITLVEALQKLGGGNGKGKAFLMVPTETGYSLQEVEAGSTVVMPQGKKEESPAAGKTYYLDDDGVTREAEPGKPIVIIKKVSSGAGDNNPPAPRTFVIQNGEIKEHNSGTPIVIHDAAPRSSGALFSIPTSDGKTASLSLDDLQKWLDTTFKIQDHNAKVAREQESHEAKMGLLKTFKDFASKGVSALGDMSGGEDEGEED